MILELKTYDRSLAFEVMGTDNLSLGKTVEIPGNAKITYNSGLVCKEAFAPETVTFVITFGSGVAASVVANYLYEKLRGKAVDNKIKIDRKIVELDNGKIKRIIEEKIEIKS